MPSDHDPRHAEPTARFRNRSGRRILDLASDAGTLFPASEAMFDHIQVSVSARFECPSTAAFHEAVYVWGDRGGGTDSPEYAPWLIANQLPNSERYRLNSIRSPRLWLIGASGYAGLYGYRQGASDARRGAIMLNVDCNPTRWLARTREYHAVLADVSPEQLLWAPGPRHNPYTLDRNDNEIAPRELGWLDRRRRPVQHRLALTTYLGAIGDFIRMRIWPWSPANGRSNVPHQSFSHFTDFAFQSVQQAEVYWELATPDALAAVHSMCRAAHSVGDTIRETTRVNRGTELDATWFSVQLNGDAVLRVYAKTRTAVRFEIKYHGPHLRQMAARAAGSESRASVVDYLGALANDASARMGRAWNSLRTMVPQALQAGEMVDFIACMVRADVGADTGDILSILASNRAITETGENRRLIRKLERAGIIGPAANLRHGGTRRRPLLPRWSLMFDHLLQRDDCPSPFRR